MAYTSRLNIGPARQSASYMQETIHSFEQQKPIDIGNMQFPSIPGYRFQKRLGSGGMATVYLASQESLDRLVAIKVTEFEALQDEISKQRFENEARTIARLSHLGIVGIYEVGRTSDGRMYYIMPYLANGDLSQRDLRNDEAQIMSLLRTLLAALDYAHTHGIVHRDVKGENVLFDAHDRPHLTDFGIAISKRDTSRLTSVGLSVGSSGYMAPEQARGEEVDGRADIYSVGVLAFELLTGKLPFHSSDALALALMHANDAIPRLPADKQHWQGFIDRAMAKSPSKRFASAQQMLQALDKVGHDGGSKKIGVATFAGVLLIASALYSTQPWFAKPNPVDVPDSSIAPSDTAPPEVAKPATKPEQAPSQPPAKPEETKPATTKPETAKPVTKPAQDQAKQSKKHKKPAEEKPAAEKPADAVRQLPAKIKKMWSRLRRR
jgi:serine/threonine-protein kinase PpkA